MNGDQSTAGERAGHKTQEHARELTALRERVDKLDAEIKLLHLLVEGKRAAEEPPP